MYLLYFTDNLLEPKYDMCYCLTCHEKRGDKEVYTRGSPPKDYALPVGWSRFALK